MRIRCQDLYEAVWEKPVRTLAKEWGLSDVGLAKVCRRHGIPLPPLGHWAKVAVGRGMKRPPLTANPDVQITFEGAPSLKKTQLSEQGKSKLLPALAVATTARDVDTPQRLAKWTHGTAKALNRKPDSSGFLICWKECFRVSVSEAQRGRAISLLNIIETALTTAGMNWELDAKRRHVIGKMYDETISFALNERCTRTEHIEKHPTNSWLDKKTYTVHFHGDLTLRIEGYFEGRKSWSDGKTQRIEEKLPEIIEGMLAAAESMRKRTLAFEEQRKRWAEEARIRAEQERIAREEKAFLDATLKEAEDWTQANKIRQYVTHLRALISENKIELAEAGMQWLSKMEEAARRLDPALRRLSL
jgi:hypothetical protein